MPAFRIGYRSLEGISVAVVYWALRRNVFGSRFGGKLILLHAVSLARHLCKCQSQMSP